MARSLARLRRALIAPHAGLMYYRSRRARAYRTAPRQARRSHRSCSALPISSGSTASRFIGAASTRRSGVAEFDEGAAAAITSAASIVREHPQRTRARAFARNADAVHQARVAPQAKIVALLMGWQEEETARALGDGVGIGPRRSRRPARCEHRLVALSRRRDWRPRSMPWSSITSRGSTPTSLQRALNRRPDHACGGGPTVAVMRRGAPLGATDAVILKYADSGDVSGDKSAVVGYLAAALGSAITEGCWVPGSTC